MDDFNDKSLSLALLVRHFTLWGKPIAISRKPFTVGKKVHENDVNARRSR